MRKMLYLMILLLLIISCNIFPKRKVDKSLSSQFKLEKSNKDFIYTKLSKFDILKFDPENLVKGRKPVNEKFRKILHDSFDTIDSNNNKEYLYSLQKTNDNHYEFTVLSLDMESCENLTYFICNNEGNVLGKFIASSYCADGGWRLFSHGKFLDNYTYEKLSVEFEMVEVDKLDNKEIYEGDSTINRFIINSNGSVTNKEISKKHFKHKWKW